MCRLTSNQAIGALVANSEDILFSFAHLILGLKAFKSTKTSFAWIQRTDLYSSYYNKRLSSKASAVPCRGDNCSIMKYSCNELSRLVSAMGIVNSVYYENRRTWTGYGG